MKFKPLFERLIHNWLAKVICLALALVLYGFYQVIALDRKNFSARLSIQNAGIMLPASTYDNLVRVTFRGQKNDLAIITENDFSVSLDLAYYTTAGTYNVPVKVKLSPELMKLDPLEITHSPDTIQLKLEPRTYAEIPLESILQGNTADGYEAVDVRLKPSTVRISGPASLVGNLKSLPVEEIALDEKSASFTTQVKIVSPSGFIRVERNEPVDAEVRIAEKTASTRFTVPVTDLNLPALFSIHDMSSTTVEVEVSAPQSTFAGLQIADVSASLDYSVVDSDGTYELPVDVTLPYGFTLVSETPATVTVTATALNADAD